MTPDTRIPRTVWLLGIVSLLMDVSTEMVNALLPLYMATGLGASALAIGFVEGLSVAVATATRALSGVLSDISNRAKPLAVLGYGIGALSRLIFPLAVTLDHIVLAKALDRVGKGIRSAPRDAMITAAAPPGLRGASFGLRKSLDTVGGFAGPLLAVGAMLMLAGDIRSVFWLAVVPAALCMIVLVGMVQDPVPQPTKAPRKFGCADLRRLNRTTRRVIGLAALIMLARFSEAFVLLKALEVGISPAFIPLALVIMHAVYGLTAFPVGRVSDRIGRSGLLICSLGFLLAAHLSLAAASNLWIYGLGTVFWGMHMGFSQGLLGAMIADAAPDGLKGSAFGAFNLVSGLTLLSANIAAGWLWLNYGSAAPFLAGAGISALAVAILFAIRRSGNG